MAKMIPTQMDVKVVSTAERRIFGLLESDPTTGDWIVLHSLGLARRADGLYGEIDFVVIVPSEGILCLEVKGGRVSCHAGVWQTMDRKGRVHRLKKSPFMQARDSMFALRKSVIQHFGDGAAESRTPIGCTVLYVAMSRARSLLVLMISEHTRGSVERRIRAGIEKELSQ